MTEGIHFSRRLEVAILGACLLEKTAVGRTYGLLDVQSFYTDDNKKIYGMLVEMFDKNIPIDCLTVWQRMMQRKQTLHAGDVGYYLMSLTNEVVSTAHLEFHCHVVHEMWRKRAVERITSQGVDSSQDVRVQISRLSEELRDLQGGEWKKDWFTMEELMMRLATHQQQIKEGNVTFLTTGFRRIDELNGGFFNGQLIVVASRPSMGKSALVGKMAVKMARQGKRVGIVSLEMDNVQIAARVAALETSISFQSIYRNLFQDQEEQAKFHRIISNQTVTLPIYVSDKTRVDVNEIKAKAAKLRNLWGCDCIIVDYLQLVESTVTNKNYNREQEVAKISRGLKLLANDMEIPVIMVCQLNREGAKRSMKDRFPKESDLRESGAIEQDADAILMLHRDWKAGYEQDEKGGSTELEADLLGVKWRNGALFHLKLDFHPQTMNFEERSVIRGYAPVAEAAETQNPF